MRTLGTVTALGVTRDGARILAGADGGSVQLADLSHGGAPLSMTSHKGLVYQAVFSPDGTLGADERR